MSVTLRYSGTLKDRALLPRLREDFEDIAATHAWPVDLLPSTGSGQGHPQVESRIRTLAPPLVIEGLKLYVHPQTDPLWFTFDPGNQLTRLGAVPPLGLLHQAQASIQTGIGGAPLHRTVVSLLDYLKKAYVPDLQVSDESGYWEGRDMGALRRLMDR